MFCHKNPRKCCSREPEKHLFKILYLAAIKLDSFRFEHFDFALYGGS
jgi:hypothetical protein